MRSAIYRLNRWYDDLDEKHGILRFFIAMTLIMIPVLLMDFGNPTVMCIGIILLGVVAATRISGVLCYPPE